MNEVKKSVQVTEMEFNRGTEIVKKTQIELLEIKNLVYPMKSSVANLTNRMNQGPEEKEKNSNIRLTITIR